MDDTQTAELPELPKEQYLKPARIVRLFTRLLAGVGFGLLVGSLVYQKGDALISKLFSIFGV